MKTTERSIILRMVDAAVIATIISWSPAVFAKFQVHSGTATGSLEDSIEVLTIKALSEDPEESGAAVTALRDKGPIGLQAFWEAHRAELEGAPFDPADTTPAWRRLSAALDAICQQHNCHASRLFWYTDLEQAKADAAASGKPILSLRLLGKLSEEFSCANSRFFRTTLFANAEVSKYLREHFVLHWQSVRPVPRVTIDFGDGRTLERTLTGNSIHYILDAEGRPIDALPGLYGPRAFLRGVSEAERAALTASGLSGEAREAYLRQYHNTRLAAIRRAWELDLGKIWASATVQPAILEQTVESKISEGPVTRSRPSRWEDLQRTIGNFVQSVKAFPKRMPTAVEASEVAGTKFATAGEGWMVRSIATESPPPDFAPLDAKTDGESWYRIAELHADDAQLDESA